MKKRTAIKFKELISVLLVGQASRPYSNSNNGNHLLFTRFTYITSSDAEFATFQNKEFAER